MTLLASAFLFTHTATAQETYAKAMIESQGANWTKGKNWDYVNGLVAFSLLKAYEQNPTAEWTNKSYEFAENYANTALNEDGSFKNFKKGNIDNIASGKVLFYLYRREKLREEIFGSSSAQKYKNAAASSIRQSTLTRCGSMDCIWVLPSMLNICTTSTRKIWIRGAT